MFVLPCLEATKTNKIKPQLTVGYVAPNSVQFATPACPVSLVYGLSPPFGKTKDEMEERETFTASINVSDAQQVEFLAQLDKRIQTECWAIFGKKQRIKSILLDGLMKVKIGQDVQVVDVDKRPIGLDDLRAGDKIVPILKASSLWSSGGDAGACLRVAKIMLVRHAEPVVEPAVDFAF